MPNATEKKTQLCLRPLDNRVVVERDDIGARIAQIKHEMDKSISSYDLEKLEERMAKLANWWHAVDHRIR